MLWGSVGGGGAAQGFGKCTISLVCDIPFLFFNYCGIHMWQSGRKTCFILSKDHYYAMLEPICPIPICHARVFDTAGPFLNPL